MDDNTPTWPKSNVIHLADTNKSLVLHYYWRAWLIAFIWRHASALNNLCPLTCICVVISWHGPAISVEGINRLEHGADGRHGVMAFRNWIRCSSSWSIPFIIDANWYFVVFNYSMTPHPNQGGINVSSPNIVLTVSDNVLC